MEHGISQLGNEGRPGSLTTDHPSLDYPPRVFTDRSIYGRAIASGPVGPVFTGPLFSEHALHASLAEPRLLGIAWLRGAHFVKLKKVPQQLSQKA